VKGEGNPCAVWSVCFVNTGPGTHVILAFTQWLCVHKHLSLSLSLVLCVVWRVQPGAIATFFITQATLSLAQVLQGPQDIELGKQNAKTENI